MRERLAAGRARYRGDFEAGRVGKEVHSRSKLDLPPHRPPKIPGKVIDPSEILALRSEGVTLREIARRMGTSLGTVARVLRAAPKPSARSKDCRNPPQEAL